MREPLKEVKECMRRLEVALEKLGQSEAEVVRPKKVVITKSSKPVPRNTESAGERSAKAVTGRTKALSKLITTIESAGYDCISGNTRGTEVAFKDSKGKRYGFTLVGSSRVDIVGNARFTIRLRRPRQEALQWYAFTLPTGRMIVLFHRELEKLYYAKSGKEMPPTTSIGFSAEDIRKYTLAKAIKQMR